MDTSGLPQSAADRNNNDRLGQFKARQSQPGANEAIQDHPVPPANNGSATHVPGSIAANPMSAPTMNPILATNSPGALASAYHSMQQSNSSPAIPVSSPSTPMNTGVGPIKTSEIPSATPVPPAQPAAPGFIDSAKSAVSKAYNSAVDGIASAIQPAVNHMMGVGDSTKVLKDTTGILGNTMQAHPEHVTQPTIDTYATAQRQIARAEGTPLPAGVPAQGAIVNAPVPQGMPAPVPISQLPGAVEAAAKAAPKQFQMPSAEEMAAFRKQTGTAFNAKSINDKLSLERMRGGEETFDSKQANAYRAAHKDYRPGMYTKG